MPPDRDVGTATLSFVRLAGDIAKLGIPARWPAASCFQAPVPGAARHQPAPRGQAQSDAPHPRTDGYSAGQSWHHRANLRRRRSRRSSKGSSHQRSRTAQDPPPRGRAASRHRECLIVGSLIHVLRHDCDACGRHRRRQRGDAPRGERCGYPGHRQTCRRRRMSAMPINPLPSTISDAGSGTRRSAVLMPLFTRV